MNRRSFSRRQLLHATGLASGSLFLPSLMTGKQAARAADAPRRLVIFYTQHGPGYENWKMRKPGLAETTEDWEFPLDTTPEAQWSSVLQPLYANRKDLLVLDGLAYTSVFTDRNFNPHNMGTAHALTGARVITPGGFDNQGTGGAISIDQIAAQTVAVPGRVKSLHYSSAYSPWAISFLGPNMPNPAEHSPMAAFDRLFKGALPTGGGAGNADLIAKARNSVLDLVQSEYAALAPKLSTEDRQRLDKHRALVADLEMQIKGRGSIMCAAPTRPTSGGANGGPGALGATDAFIPLVASAMACDMTRVAVIVSGQLQASDFGGPPGDVHNDLAHNAQAGTANSKHMANYYRKHAAQFSKLITLYSDMGLLDTTALMWVTELSNGPHDFIHNLAVLAGTCGGAFRTGRYVKYKDNGPNPATNGNFGGRVPLGPAHSKLLVSVLQAMGVNQNEMPVKTATGSGALPGQAVDMAGPLPRLK